MRTASIGFATVFTKLNGNPEKLYLRLYAIEMNGTVSFTGPCRFTRELKRKESEYDGAEQGFGIVPNGTGTCPKDLARIYNDLFERRQEGDYLDFVSFNESQVLPWIARAEKLIEYISDYIEKQTRQEDKI
jgi:hypothetical protein